MNLNQLALFHAVAQEGSVSRGAGVLHISQPAVSKQLRDFEKSLGVALFHRLSSGVQLTQAGALLFEYSTKIFALETEAEQALDELRVLERGCLVVGASSTIGTYLLPEVCAQFGAKYPKIELHLEIFNTQEVQRRLVENEIDVGLGEGLTLFPEIEAEPFAWDEIVAVVSRDHVLATSESIEVEELIHHPILLRERGSGTRDVVQQAFVAQGIALQPSMSLGSTEAIKRAVASGVGVAFVSRLALKLEAEPLRIVELRSQNVAFKILRPLQRLRIKGRYESRAAREFVKTLRAANVDLSYDANEPRA